MKIFFFKKFRKHTKKLDWTDVSLVIYTCFVLSVIIRFGYKYVNKSDREVLFISVFFIILTMVMFISRNRRGKQPLYVLIIPISIIFGLYFKKFHGKLSSQSTYWADFGTYISGLITPFLTFIMIVLLIKSNKTSSDTLNIIKKEQEREQEKYKWGRIKEVNENQPLFVVDKKAAGKDKLIIYFKNQGKNCTLLCVKSSEYTFKYLENNKVPHGGTFFIKTELRSFKKQQYQECYFTIEYLDMFENKQIQIFVFEVSQTKQNALSEELYNINIEFVLQDIKPYF